MKLYWISPRTIINLEAIAEVSWAMDSTNSAHYVVTVRTTTGQIHEIRDRFYSEPYVGSVWQEIVTALKEG